MRNNINTEDYIKPDSQEMRVGKRSKSQLKILQEDNRGVDIDSRGKLYIRNRVFAEYVLKRIDLVRIDNNKRLLKNQRTHVYEMVSDVILKSCCMDIMDELDDSYYELVPEGKLIGFIDKQVKSLRRLDIDPRYFLFPNGIYEVRTHTFDASFTTDFVTTYQMGFNYDPTAKCPHWERSLKKMFPYDTNNLIAVLQEMFGYTFLYGDAPADTLFYLFGKGRNGKSVVTSVLSMLHGTENIAGVSLTSLNDRFALSGIYDKKVCLCPENQHEKIKDTSTLKALTGRDAVKVEIKYETPFTVRISTKIIVNSNFYLRTDDNTSGFWGRILPIPFKVTFLPQKELQKRPKNPLFQKRNTNLERIIKKELSGIFNWSMEGLKRLKQNKWVFTESKQINELKEEMMSYCCPISAFVHDKVVQGKLSDGGIKGDRVRSSELQKKFMEWANDKALDIEDFIDSRKFRKALIDSLSENGINYDIVKNSVDFFDGIIVKE